MRTHRHHNLPVVLAAMLVIGVAAFASVSWAQDRGACVTALVPEAFTLPDGSLHAAGKLTLCTHSVLNPVAGLHRVFADGDGAVLLMSRRSRADENTDRSPALLFRRAPDVPLELVAYVVPFNQQSLKYTFKTQGGISSFESAARNVAPAKELVTLLASNGN